MKLKTKFPPASMANKDGLLAVSRNISRDMLLSAYLSGIFPWPCDESCVLWFAPPRRAVLDFSEFRASKKLLRQIGGRGYHLEVNCRFQEVIRSCASQSRPGQDGTWITPEIIKAYADLKEAGFAASFECVDSEGRLAGGLYGVLLGRYFSGESMFHHQPDASKFALVELVKWLQARGLSWLDAQSMTPLLARFGAKELPRKEFMARIKADSFIPDA